MTTAPRFGGVKIIMKISDILKNPYLLRGDNYGNNDAALDILNAIKNNEIYNSPEEAKITGYYNGTIDNTSPRKISVKEFKKSILLWFKAVYENAEVHDTNYENYVDVNYLKSQLI